jgi:hypothetical protein
MFDMLKGEIALNLHSPDGPKKVLVRFPTDSEFIEWRRKKKIVQKDLGRRKFQIESSVPEACDLTLLSEIRLDKENGPSLDEAEAYYAIGQLAEAEVKEQPQREGSAYVIRMKIMRKLTTKHTLRVPSVREMMDYERMRSSVVFGQYGQQEIRINFRASAELYDKLKLSTEGYANEIPVPHKAEAVNVLLQEIRGEQEETHESDDDQD